LNGEKFQKILFSAIEEASSGSIVTLGIEPKEPNTSYGYIEYIPASSDVMSVLSFKEKPSLENATKYIASANHLWNSGIFILKASVWIDAISECNPDILKTMKLSFCNRVQDGNFIRPDTKHYKNIQEKSIDYAVMEPCISRGFLVKVIKMDLDWEDLGEWDRIYRINQKDKDFNVIKGDCHLIKSNNNLIISSHKLVTAIGINNLLVVDTPDALLVANLSESNSIKQLVNFLIEKSRIEVDHNRKVYRPWGWYDTLEEGIGFKVKRIQVEPGASLSLQKHKYRSEHWVVTKGEADIICDNTNFTLTINQSSFILAHNKFSAFNNS
jgi:mannose-1-phosphate guanylyltransferase/mannose-6-phosphate isomerase